MGAHQILAESAAMLVTRGQDRDRDGERSMGRIVAMFNAGTGRDLTEREGHVFMVCVKLVRAMLTPTGKRDDYVDGINYLAMAGEVAEALAEAHEAERLEAVAHG